MKTLLEFINMTGLRRGATCKEVVKIAARYFSHDEMTGLEENHVLGDIVGYFLIDPEEWHFTYQNLI